MEAYSAYNQIKTAIDGFFTLKPTTFQKRINKKYKNYRKRKGMKGFRVPEYEEFIIKDAEVCSLYASLIVRGKLPERLHNVMICESLVKPNAHYVRSYFELILDD